MATDIYVRRVEKGFVPATRLDYERMKEIPVGREVKAKITQPRNLKHHNLFFAMVGKVFENQDTYRTPEQLFVAIKVRLGYVDRFEVHDGTTVIKPKSIAFDKMDQTEFNAFFDAAVQLVCDEIIPGLGSEELRHEIDEMVA